MFQIEGILREITPVQSGTSAQGNSWQRCEAIVEAQDGQYVTTYVFTVFNKDITIPVGSTVVCDFYVKSQNYNGKWFTNLTLYKMEPSVQQPTYQPPAQPQYNQQGYQQPMQQQPRRQPAPQMPAQPVRPTPAPAPQQYQQPQMPPMPTAPVPQQQGASVEEVNDLPF